jgi:hypothetical protein
MTLDRQICRSVQRQATKHYISCHSKRYQNQLHTMLAKTQQATKAKQKYKGKGQGRNNSREISPTDVMNFTGTTDVMNFTGTTRKRRRRHQSPQNKGDQTNRSRESHLLPTTTRSLRTQVTAMSPRPPAHARTRSTG